MRERYAAASPRRDRGRVATKMPNITPVDAEPASASAIAAAELQRRESELRAPSAAKRSCPCRTPQPIGQQHADATTTAVATTGRGVADVDEPRRADTPRSARRRGRAASQRATARSAPRRTRARAEPPPPRAAGAPSARDARPAARASARRTISTTTKSAASSEYSSGASMCAITKLKRKLTRFVDEHRGGASDRARAHDARSVPVARAAPAVTSLMRRSSRRSRSRRRASSSSVAAKLPGGWVLPYGASVFRSQFPTRRLSDGRNVVRRGLPSRYWKRIVRRHAWRPSSWTGCEPGDRSRRPPRRAVIAASSAVPPLRSGDAMRRVRSGSDGRRSSRARRTSSPARASARRRPARRSPSCPRRRSRTGRRARVLPKRASMKGRCTAS